MQFFKNGCDALSGCCHQIKLMLLCGMAFSQKTSKKILKIIIFIIV